MPPRARKPALPCIVVWLGVITFGRLIAYEVESIPAASTTTAAPAHVAALR
mgnify:CR=1 FL=1